MSLPYIDTFTHSSCQIQVKAAGKIKDLEWLILNIPNPEIYLLLSQLRAVSNWRTCCVCITSSHLIKQMINQTSTDILHWIFPPTHTEDWRGRPCPWILSTFSCRCFLQLHSVPNSLLHGRTLKRSRDCSIKACRCLHELQAVFRVAAIDH